MLYRIDDTISQVELNDKWGIVDCHNNTIVKCEWDWVYPPKDGKFKVRLGSEIKLIDGLTEADRP